jgi:glyoxylase-like metal-dependent hydrolase (beta-lactamase superfamily II)
MLQLGDMRVFLINDGITRADPGGPFGLVPRVLYSRYFELDANFTVPMSLHCLLIQVDGKNIVVDTGLGVNLTDKMVQRWGLTRPQGTLFDGLARLGVMPEDVHLVIDTHLHSDHCAGNVIYNPEDEAFRPAFPNAEYVVQRREYEDAIRPNERTAATYLSPNWDVLVAQDRLRLLDGDTELAPGVFGVQTPGHTPGHMSVRLERDGQHALFACDMASYAVHFERLGWMTAYDVEPLVTLETKRRWQQWALETLAVIIFPHDPKRPAGRLGLDERERPALTPIEWDYA